MLYNNCSTYINVTFLLYQSVKACLDKFYIYRIYILDKNII